MRIQDPNFPPDVHPTVQDGFADVLGVINGGTYEFPLQANVPNDTPEGSTAFRVVADPGTGRTFVYVWNSVQGLWKGAELF